MSGATFGEILAERERRRRAEEEAAKAASTIAAVTDSQSVTAPESVTASRSVTDSVGEGSTPQSVTDRQSVTAPESVTDQQAVTFPLLNVPHKPGYLALPNTILHELLPRLGTFEQVVYLRLYALSHGFKQDTCFVSMTTLAKSCGLSDRTVLRAVIRLESLGLVARIGAKHSGSNDSRGSRFRVNVPQSVTDSQSVTDHQTVTDSRAVTDRQANNKEKKKEIMQSAPPQQEEVAPMYRVRLLAVRLREAHRGDALYTPERLRQDLDAALIAEGKNYPESVIEEALSAVR